MVIGAIASWLMHKPLYSFFPIQSIHYNAWGVFWLFIAGASIGALVFLIGFVGSRLVRWNKRRKQGKERKLRRAQNQTELLRKGYIPTEKVWVDFLRSSVNQAKNTLGKGYTLLVKVYLKEPINNQQQMTGLLSHFEPNRPYDIVLFPKHTFQLEKTYQGILEELTKDKLNPITSVLEPGNSAYAATIISVSSILTLIGILPSFNNDVNGVYLRLNLQTDNVKYVVGSPITVTIHVFTETGDPVSAEVKLSLNQVATAYQFPFDSWLRRPQVLFNTSTTENVNGSARIVLSSPLSPGLYNLNASFSALQGEPGVDYTIAEVTGQV